MNYIMNETTKVIHENSWKYTMHKLFFKKKHNRKKVPKIYDDSVLENILIT